MNNLESLLKELGCRTPAEEIPSDRCPTILDFLQRESEYRKQHKIKRLLSQSGLKQVKTLDQFDWLFNPKISKEEILSFVNSPWIEKAFNLVLIGDTGLGKSHISAAICYEAILRGYPTACITAFDLVSKIHKAYNPASKIDYYAKIRVLFQIISKRNEILPTIVTTNLSPKEWGSIFSATAASAILDRLSFNGRFITFEGRSYRLLKKHKMR
jgi:DNA replication protein DnaC